MGKKKPGSHLYIIQSAGTGAVKVGRSSDPQRRLKELQTGAPYRLRFILIATGEGKREKHLHRLMRARATRRGGEWFDEGALAELPIDIYARLTLDDEPED